MGWLRRSRDREQIRPLIELTGQFLLGEIEPATYDTQFCEVFSGMAHVEEERFFALENLAVACHDYVEQPELRDDPRDLDEDGLRAAAVRALVRLSLA